MTMTMTCASAQQELVGFHFGLVEGDARRELEAHLATCQSCCADFLAVKRDVETAEGTDGPAPAVRARVRAAVARELHPPVARWSWWERPLAFTCAGLTVFLAVLAVQSIAATPGTPPHSLDAPSHPTP